MANQNARTMRGKDVKLHVHVLTIIIDLPQFLQFDLLVKMEAIRKLSKSYRASFWLDKIILKLFECFPPNWLKFM